MRLQDSVSTLIQAAPPQVQFGVAGVSVVAAAVWHAFTGVVAAVMALLFLCDLAIGVFKALHIGGLDAFEWTRFWRKFLELGAAMVGIFLAVAIDLLLRQIGTPEDAAYFSTGIIGAISAGFGASAFKNLAYFFPAVSAWFDAFARRNGPPKRRAADRAAPPEVVG